MQSFLSSGIKSAVQKREQLINCSSSNLKQQLFSKWHWAPGHPQSPFLHHLQKLTEVDQSPNENCNKIALRRKSQPSVRLWVRQQLPRYEINDD
jgi:hypothetical protein